MFWLSHQNLGTQSLATVEFILSGRAGWDGRGRPPLKIPNGKRQNDYGLIDSYTNELVVIHLAHTENKGWQG